MAQTLRTTFSTKLPQTCPHRPRVVRTFAGSGLTSVLQAAAKDLLQPRPQTIAELLKAAKG